MKQSFMVYSGFGLRQAWPAMEQLAFDGFAGGHEVKITIATSDGPTDAMRNKWHAMCTDLAKQVSVLNGMQMDLHRWKAGTQGEAMGQQWIPSWDGKTMYPFRKPSETLTKKEYCDCIEVAYMIGAHFGVVWSDPKEQKTRATA